MGTRTDIKINTRQGLTAATVRRLQALKHACSALLLAVSSDKGGKVKRLHGSRVVRVLAFHRHILQG